MIEEQLYDLHRTVVCRSMQRGLCVRVPRISIRTSIQEGPHNIQICIGSGYRKIKGGNLVGILCICVGASIQHTAHLIPATLLNRLEKLDIERVRGSERWDGCQQGYA